MRSKASYFSVSIPLVRENLRRLWAIPAISFLVYFLSGVFPILMNYNKINYIASYLEMSLNNMQPFYMAMHLLAPVIAAVVLFRYLQTPGSVAVMHSLPFTRAKLFNSNLLSGILLVCGPVILNGLILLAISKPTFREWGYAPGAYGEAAVNVFSRSAVGNWIFTSILIVLVLYCVAVFAAIVTGNSTVHLLASYFFIFLIPLLYAVFHAYFQEFLYGFDLSGDWVNVGLSISPYTAILSNQGHFSLNEILFYCFTIVLMVGISAFLYNKRKLERATDALTFQFLKPVLCYIITFLGMTLLGFYFQVLGEGEFDMYMGFAAGTVIFFIIGQMIVLKTVRIFNPTGLRYFVVYVLIAAVFLVGLNFDATGFERRVPAASKVESAVMNFDFYPISLWQYFPDDEKRNVLIGQDNIEALTSFHRSVLENRERFENPDGNFYSTTFRLAYDIGTPFRINRSYQIDYPFYAASSDLKQIFESEEYKTSYSFNSFGLKDFTRMAVFTDEYQGTSAEIKNSQSVFEFISMVERDFQAMTFEEAISLRPKYARAEVFYRLPGGNEGSISFQIPETAENTIAWLADHGHKFGVTADMVERIDIYSPNILSEQEAWEKEMARPTTDMSYAPPNRTPLLSFTDKEKIQLILDSYDAMQIDYDKGYTVEIIYQPIVDQDNPIGPLMLSGYLNYGLDFLD